MIAKLIKTGKDKYHIESEEFDGVHLACYPHDITKQKLSLENCKTIEKGYDLDELVEKAIKENDIEKEDLSFDEQVQRTGGFTVGFQKGFQKALEILGDKKYTEKDMYIFGEYVWKYSANTHPIFDNPKGDEGVDEILELKTKWDVFIVMACGKENGCDEDSCEDCQIEPSLDKDGCLRLTQLNFQK